MATFADVQPRDDDATPPIKDADNGGSPAESADGASDDETVSPTATPVTDSVTTTEAQAASSSLESSLSLTASAAFSESQMEELRASFDECDKEKTGFISVGDLDSVVCTLGYNYGPQAIREMIDKFDLKSSGEIDFEEFVEMMATTTKGGRGGGGETAVHDEEEEIRQIFKVFDRNKTGFIDVDELRAVMKDLGEKVTEEDLDAMMKEADVAGNGVISYDEFLLMFQNSSGRKYHVKEEQNSSNNGFCCRVL